MEAEAEAQRLFYALRTFHPTEDPKYLRELVDEAILHRK